MTEIGPLTGEPLALDLVNTCLRLPDDMIDFLATVRGLREWLSCESHRLPSVAPRAVRAPTKAARAAVLEVRGHATTAIEHVRHGERPTAGDLLGLNEAMTAAPVITELVATKTVPRLTSRRAGDPDLHIAAALAEATAALLADPAAASVRQCEADFCVLLFLPSHPRRRWCSPTICGNRVRVGRYYQRLKEGASRA